MRKLIVVLCIVALTLAMAVSAMAGSSIAEIKPEVADPTVATVESVAVDTIAKTVEGVVADKAVAAQVAECLTKVVTEAYEPQTLVTDLGGAKNVPADIEKYTFSTGFSKIDCAEKAQVPFTGVNADTRLMFIGPDGVLQILEPVLVDGEYVFEIPGPGLIAQIDLTKK